MPPLAKSKPTSLPQSDPTQGILTIVLAPVLGDTVSDVDGADVEASTARPEEELSVAEARAELAGIGIVAPLLRAIAVDEAPWFFPCVALTPSDCESPRGSVSRPHAAPALPSVPP